MAAARAVLFAPDGEDADRLTPCRDDDKAQHVVAEIEEHWDLDHLV